MFNKMLDLKIITKQSSRIINHLSHVGLVTHDKLGKIALLENIIVAYDGLEVEI